MEPVTGPVRVLHLLSSLEMGGTEKMVCDLFTACAKSEKARLYYIVMNDKWLPEYRTALEQSGAKGSFFQRREGDKHPRYLRMLLRFVRQNKIDVIHAHTTGGKYWAMLLKVLTPPLKLVYSVHSTFDVVRYQGARLALHRRMVDWNIANSDIVLTQCHEKELVKSSRVYNGFMVGAFRQRLPGPPAAPPRLVLVARIRPQIKGHDLLLEAAAQCKAQGFPGHITLMGEDEGPCKSGGDAMKELAAKLGIADSVEFTGKRTDVAEILCRYDVLVCPSRKEGFGLTIVEGMAAGLLVIAADGEGPAELVADGQTGFLFRNGDAAHLAQTILRALRDTPQQQRDEMVKLAKELAGGFDITGRAEGYTAVYRQVAAKRVGVVKHE